MPAKGENRAFRRKAPPHFLPNPSDPRGATKAVMQLVINGEARSFSGLGDVAALVSALGLDTRKVAVERNLEIVPRSRYAATPLADGDRIEIVHFIGGG
jgi:sulfur carrier protein